MSMRVATFATSNSLLKAAMRVQAREAEASMQQASGLVSSDYGGLGRDGGTLASLQASYTRSQAYQQAAENTDNRVTVMYNAVGSISDVLTNALSNATNFDLSTSGTDVLAVTAQEALEQIVSLMNTQYDDDYLFSGSATKTAPVDLDAYVSQTSPSSSDTSYYQGDDTIASVRVSSEQTVSYGVTADNTSFEEAIRALSMLASGTADSDTISEASSLLSSAIDGLSDVQAGLSVKASALEDAASAQETYQSTASELISDIAAADVTTVAAELSTYQTQLEAAYSAIGKIASLSLSSYLK